MNNFGASSVTALFFFPQEIDRYCFITEWYDPNGAIVRKYQFFYYANDSTIEMVSTYMLHTICMHMMQYVAVFHSVRYQEQKAFPEKKQSGEHQAKRSLHWKHSKCFVETTELCRLRWWLHSNQIINTISKVCIPYYRICNIKQSLPQNFSFDQAWCHWQERRHFGTNLPQWSPHYAVKNVSAFPWSCAEFLCRTST
jgi:hypothetical protein